MDGEPRGQESVVIFEQSSTDWAQTHKLISNNVQAAAVTRAPSESALEEIVARGGTDVVVLDCDWPLDKFADLFCRLKNTDSQPSIVVVSKNADSRMVNELYKHGCQRLILKDERWTDELSVTLRHLLRYRQVVDENIRIRTRLTEANQLLDQRNKRLDEFSATLAHDIRGPLGSISMKLEYLLDHYNQGLDARSSELLQRSLGSCRRLTDIVQGMYEFAKLGSKATKMDYVNLTVLVEEVGADSGFDPKLDIELALSELPEVWGNAALLRRVLHNLISNAVKYNDKARIKISVSSPGIVVRALGRFAQIRVEDNGPGIPESDLATIFSMFRRGSQAEGQGEGAGIGLAVVKRIVELHFGEIQVESHPGEGTAFTFTLPVEKISVEASE